MTAPFALLPHLRRDRIAPDPVVRAARDEPGGSGVIPVAGPDGQTFWVVTRYDDVRAVLRDPELFSSADTFPDAPRDPDGEGVAGRPLQARPGDLDDRRPGAMLTADPPEHTRLRTMLSRQFTVRRVRWLEPRITAVVDDCLAAMAHAGPPVDVVPAFAIPVPGRVICELLGVPAEHQAAFTDRLVRQLTADLPDDERDRLDRESRAYLTDLVGIVRGNPGDDVLGMLVREHGDELRDVELVNIADLLLFAGHETVANTLGLGLVAVLENPSQAALLRDDPGPETVATAVDEVLRYTAVLQQTIPRRATRATTLGGYAVSEGDVVMVSLPAASRDPRHVDDADTLDLSRATTSHLAFGYGVHHCLGAALARAELGVALSALFRRFPTLTLATDRVEFRPPGVFYGVASLPVTW